MNAYCEKCGKLLNGYRSKLCRSCAKIGILNPNWNGGVTITKRGYKKVKDYTHLYADPHHFVYEHRLIMGNYLGRYLNDNERVHHKNGNKLDNRIENLELFSTHSEHLKNGHNKRKILVKCFTCGKQFYRQRARIRSYIFCSHACNRPSLWVGKGIINGSHLSYT